VFAQYRERNRPLVALSRPRTCTCTQTYYPYRLILSLASNVLCRLALEPLTGTILHAQRKKRFVLSARGSHVAGKKSMEGHHDAFCARRTILLGNPSQLPPQDVYAMCERRTAMESFRAGLIAPRGAQWASHSGEKGGKEASHDQRRRATPRRTVSVVNARNPNDALGSQGREVLQYRSHGGSSPRIP